MVLYIGLLSGTSMDGIDAAVVDVQNHQLIAGITQKYRTETIKRLHALMQAPHAPFAHYMELNHYIGKDFAAAVALLLKSAQLKPKDIKAIGSHGQTIIHSPLSDIPYTLQLGCAHTIAEESKITVVADFRTRDLVVGGQGAPLAPLYHQALFHQEKLPLVVVNIGGIANISYLKADGTVLGFDTGPGNCLMDAWIAKQQGKAYDTHGAWAQEGQLECDLLKQLLQDSFFQKPYPKSLDKSYFSLAWLAPYIAKRSYKDSDIQTTITHLTALSIAQSIQSLDGEVQSVYVCGGGAHNRYLMTLIKLYLGAIFVDTTLHHKRDPDFIEAMLFAWLASKTINQEAVDLSHITGAKRKAILGVIYPYAQ